MTSYTKTFTELRDAAEFKFAQDNITQYEGFSEYADTLRIHREDGLPWLELGVPTAWNESMAQQFTQELSNSLGVNILFNSFNKSGGESVLKLVLDIEPKNAIAGIVPAYSMSAANTSEAIKFMEDYGDWVCPITTSPSPM